MLLVSNLKLKYDYSHEDLERSIKKVLHTDKIKEVKIHKRSLDLRESDNIHYVISAYVSLDPNLEKKIIGKGNHKNITLTNPKKYIFVPELNEENTKNNLEEKINVMGHPGVVGSGPAGYFAALKLAMAGLSPIVFERGKAVEERTKDVENFWNGGSLNKESNVSFGEGGAGTFSDGKLFTGNKDKFGIIKDVLETFHRFGAKEEICYDAKPHIGTDVLKTVMKNMREEIVRLGGEVRFSSLVKEIEKQNDIYKLVIKDEDTEYEITSPAVILAIGHSARDTFSMLNDKKVSMEQKPFALGLRIEHKRELIDKDRYKTSYIKDKYPAADYKLTYHASNERSVFSFCMCPGGYVVNASSDENSMVVNGMSYSGRNGENSNSAIVVGVTPDDYPGDDPLSAIAFQQSIEEKFYKAGNGAIPVQTFGDFEKGNITKKFGDTVPQIKGKYQMSDLSSLLPPYVYQAMVEGIHNFSRTIKGFDNSDAVLSGVESRTSSPVRILRDDSGMAPGFSGLFPTGEGAGYAGGITSAAQDGIKQAENLVYYLINK